MIKANERCAMLTINLSEQTKAFLDETLSSDLDADAKVRQLIRAEYLRELSRFRRTDLAMVHKYSMTFDEFLAQSMVEKLGYSWEVEQDAMAWETAVGGILTMERKLKQLQELDHEFTA
jgi:hypothetical protein